MIWAQRKNRVAAFLLAAFFLVIASCGTKSEPAIAPDTSPLPENPTATQTISIPTASPTPQTLSAPVTLGPNKENFPTDYNPLTGQQVEDPSMLQTPAMLVSISHFPTTARPQFGLSFTPWVFEFYITEGATRFLSVFYGEYPKPEIPATGDCKIREEIFSQTANTLGNRVWLDENKNGRQESFESALVACV